MIKISCSHCGHSTVVPDEYSGKGLKCSKCNNPLQVSAAQAIKPSEPKSAFIKFRCNNCNQKMGVPLEYADKRVRCKKCNQRCVVPRPKQSEPQIQLDIPLTAEKGGSEDVLDDGSLKAIDDLSDLAAGPAVELVKPQINDKELQDNESVKQIRNLVKEQQRVRVLPWPIDILLYPFNTPGLVFFGIATGIPLLVNLIVWWFDYLASVIPPFFLIARLFLIIGVLIKIVILLYVFWYFCECIRSSAEGHLSAPETMTNAPGPFELLSQMFKIFACFLLLWSPVIYYLMFALKAYMPELLFIWPFYLAATIFNPDINIEEIYTFFIKDEFHFFSLVGLSVFFFPIGLLAVVMFDSLRGLNPILIISSIFSCFFQYCGVVLVFCVPVVVFVTCFRLVFRFMPLISGLLVLKVLHIYLLMINGHVLGRFYWKCQNKLYWEV